jgi:hypothetical protein
MCWSDGVEYNLGRRYQRFRAVVGLDDETPSGVEIVFTATLDNKVLAGGEHKLAVSEIRKLDLNVAGGNRLVLAVRSDGSDCHLDRDRVTAVWGTPRLS